MIVKEQNVIDRPCQYHERRPACKQNISNLRDVNIARNIRHNLNGQITLIWSKEQTKFTNYMFSNEVLLKVVELMESWVFYESLESWTVSSR